MAKVISWVVALVAVTAYAFNSQVFVWIGNANHAGKLFELFLCHIGMIVIWPFFLCNGVQETYRDTGKSTGKLLLDATIAAFFQMEIFYLWFLASVRIPTQVLAAIFQSSIAVVYVLSILFLKEPVVRIKVLGVCLAVMGVCSTALADLPESKDEKHEHLWGVAYAIGADFSKACYQVWFKKSFGQPTPKFMLLFGFLIALVHIFPILPVIVALDSLGVPDARISFPVSSGAIRLIGLAALISSSVSLGFLTTIALESPIFLASMQLLAIPLSVLFDATVRNPPVSPSINSLPGYLCILVAFVLLTLCGDREAAQKGAKESHSDAHMSQIDLTKRTSGPPSISLLKSFVLTQEGQESVEAMEP